MRKLTALGMITLTLTSMIPLTANAAVNCPYKLRFWWKKCYNDHWEHELR